MNKYSLSVLGSFLFTLGAFLGIAVYLSTLFVNVLLVSIISLVALIVGIKMLASSNLPILKFLIGISFAVALFGQANVSGGYINIILAVIVLSASLLELRKDGRRDI
jgi:hypothetical protein